MQFNGQHLVGKKNSAKLVGGELVGKKKTVKLVGSVSGHL